MGHHQERRLEIGPEVEQVILQIDPREGVERGERLIEQQHFGPRDQGARERHALSLAARQFPRPDIRFIREPDPPDLRGHARRPLLFRTAGETEGNIIGDGEPRQQPRLLEDDADFLVGGGDLVAVEYDPAEGRAIETRDHAQHRRFAATGTADDGNDLTRPDAHAHTRERAHTIGIGLADILKGQHSGALVAAVRTEGIFPAQKRRRDPSDQ
jgi:hypothetical protein